MTQYDHELLLSVYYEGFRDETLTTLPVSVTTSIANCVTGASYFANPIEYVYIVEEDNAPLSLARADTLCGPWVLTVDLGNLVNKAEVTQADELVLSNISAVDAGEYLIDVTYTFETFVDQGIVKVII